MEGLRKKKTVYLETLENLFQELTQARSISSGGRKLILLGLLYDVHRVHQFFLQIENNLSESIDIHNILLYDADVDYNDWSVKLDIKYDVKAFYMPDEEEEDADEASVKETLWHIFDTFSRDELKGISCDRTNNVKLLAGILMNDVSIDNLVSVLNESIVALRESLLHIHTCMSKHRITLDEGEELYRHESKIFVEKEEARVMEEFEEWKDQFDEDDVVIKRHLEGKYHVEMLTLFMSDFLKPKISSQAETNTSEYGHEYKSRLFMNIPQGMDVEVQYSALRELFDYKDGVVVPKIGHIGKYFFKHRKEVTIAHRIAYFRFVKMLWLIEEEKKPKEGNNEELNYTGIITAMNRTYFPKCGAALNKEYNAEWLNNYMQALMESKYKDAIAVAWANDTTRKQVCCAILGTLKDKGVFKSTYAALAKMIYDGDTNEKEEDRKRNLRTLGKYIGEGKKHVIGKWTKDY